MNAKIFKSSQPLTLESGYVFPQLEIAYHTYGSLSPEKDNVIWVCHALTANSEVADWWPHTIETGKFLDPEKYFVVCANILGSHYGTTGPLSIDPQTGAPYFHGFPQFTVRDIVAAHQRLARHLGIDRVELLIGSSLGGFQCMEWALIQPEFAKRVALIATTPQTMPWASAFNESQRMAIDADATFRENSPLAGMAGLATARSIALLSYRGGVAYDLTQADNGAETDPEDCFKRKAHSYQQYQGKKLCNRFNAYSYYRLTHAVDSHDVGRGRGGVEAALKSFAPKTLVIAISGDILFPPKDHQPFIDFIPNVEYHVIDSTFGHDGFLIEHQKLNQIIQNFMNEK